VDVSRYARGIEYLLNSGYSVIRMGRVAEKPLPIRHTNLVDLPFERNLFENSNNLKERELLELGIFEKSEFCISTGLGLDSFATLLRKKVYYCDYYSIYNLYSSKLFPLFLPKGYVCRETGRILTPHEILDSRMLFFQKAEEFHAANVKIVNCEEDAIFGFFNDVIDIEMHKKQIQETPLSLLHKKTLQNMQFRDKFTPQISDYWLNNI
jgi:putative glycosyltransferase (TIGR04372 family)